MNRRNFIAGSAAAVAAATTPVSVKNALPFASAIMGHSVADCFVVWGQGESDGGPSCDLDTYSAHIETLKTQLRADLVEQGHD